MTCSNIEKVECIGNWQRNGHIVGTRKGGMGLVCDPELAGGDVDIDDDDFN
jgi:hypothetical protein